MWIKVSRITSETYNTFIYNIKKLCEIEAKKGKHILVCATGYVRLKNSIHRNGDILTEYFNDKLGIEIYYIFNCVGKIE